MLQGTPYQMLSVPSASWQGVGLTDLALPAKGRYCAIATAQNGHVRDCMQFVSLYPMESHDRFLLFSKLNSGYYRQMLSMQLSWKHSMLVACLCSSLCGCALHH